MFWFLGACNTSTDNRVTTTQPNHAIDSPTEDENNLNLTIIASNKCPGAPDQRVEVGDRVIVCTREDLVLLKLEPHHKADYSHRLVPGAELDVTGEPVCDSIRSYWYWPVRTKSGYEGWIAEGGDNRDPYFICPVDESD